MYTNAKRSGIVRDMNRSEAVISQMKHQSRNTVDRLNYIRMKEMISSTSSFQGLDNEESSVGESIQVEAYTQIESSNRDDNHGKHVTQLHSDDIDIDNRFFDLDEVDRHLRCKLCLAYHSKRHGAVPVVMRANDTPSLCRLHQLKLHAGKILYPSLFTKPTFTIKVRHAEYMGEYIDGVRLCYRFILPESISTSSKYTHVQPQSRELEGSSGFQGILVKPAKLLADSTNSPSSFDFLLGEFRKCESTHSCGREPILDKMPTRLLDISLQTPVDDTHVRLVDGAVVGAQPYVALSHCWGTTKQLTTTTENIALHQQGIPISMLSKTCQDAVMVARKFAKYLWIDTLCIIQQDSEDWKRESSRMTDVYEGALLTIAATAANDHLKGLFFDKPHPYRPHNLGRIKFKGQICNLHAAQLWGHMGRQYHVSNDFPLLKRAWSYQERMLSPRVIHFSREELYWECKMACNCEYGNFNQLSNPKHAYETVFKRIHKVVRASAWRQTITTYARLAITNSSDRLPALAGIARQMQRFYTGKYCAGLWQEEMPAALCWSNRFPALRISGPSWSWASLDAPVDYPDGFRLDFFTPRLDIISCACEPVGLDPYGEIARGFLRLSGHFVPDAGSIIFSQQFQMFYLKTNDGQSDDSLGGCHLNVLIDGGLLTDKTFDNDIVTNKSVALVRVGTLRESPTGLEEVCLVLEAVAGVSQTYRRVGLGHLETSGLAFFDWQEDAIITLI